MRSFNVEPHYSPRIIESASTLRGTLFSDNTDCIITANAIQLGEKLDTEDSRILKKKEKVRKKYGLQVLTFRELLIQ